MKIVALIPARGNSKRIKNKNLQQINGAPLIGWAIKQAFQSELISEIYVSTDSLIIADVARNYGAKVPFIRPSELAQDNSKDFEVFKHFLDWYKKEYDVYPDLIAQIRPTSPLRKSNDIDNAIRILMDNTGADSIRSVSIPHQSPYKMWYKDDDNLLTSILTRGDVKVYDCPTQSLPTVFEQDGVIDVIRSSTIRNKHSMSGDLIFGYNGNGSAWDVDTVSDLNYINYIMQENFSSNLMVLPNLKGRVGIIQGRLTDSNQLQCFPEEWDKEFEKARLHGYSYIEFIRDRSYNEKNPLWNGLQDSLNMKDTATKEGLAVRTICDDFILNCNWATLTTDDYHKLLELLIIAKKIGVKKIVYPLMEKSEINSPRSINAFLEVIKKLAMIIEYLQLEIVLEITNDIDFIQSLIEMIDEESITICVDTGNLTQKGINPETVIMGLKERIGLIHLKDRDINGNNVPIGEGIVDFVSIFKALKTVNYQKDFTIESSRGGDTLLTAKKNMEVLESYVQW